MHSLLTNSLDRWRRLPPGLPALGRKYELEEQRSRERALDAFLAAIQSSLTALPKNRTDRERVHVLISQAFVRLGREALDLNDEHLALLLQGGFSAIGTELGRMARRLDVPASVGDIVQASRNAWTACGLQLLCGRPMRLTPSIFAYSMLYPVTDNYMDDPQVQKASKLEFSVRFGERLAGQPCPARGDHEALTWRLIEMIESEHARSERPRVYESLLAIHHAQQASLRLMRQPKSPDQSEVSELSFWKGGSSVLADGYLAAGVLAPVEERFIFDWGVLLQLADDLQDVREDLAGGATTLFTMASRDGTLNELTARTLQFGQQVMAEMADLPSHADASDVPGGVQALRQLIERSSKSVLIRAAGELGESYSPGFLTELEAYSPFRFAYLRERRQQMVRRSSLMGKLFEAFLDGDDGPVFPLLPNSLMPR